jgi:hypothetical protein
VYDAAMRGVVDADPGAICRLLDIPVTTASGVPEMLQASFASPGVTLHADAVIRVGVNHVAHLEYERRPSTDLVARMLAYLLAIALRHPVGRVTQHVVLLGEGQVRERPEALVGLFQQTVSVYFLRDMAPATFLKEVALAPMAVLGRGDDRGRAQAFSEALRMIRDRAGSRMPDLLEFSATLARITLDQRVIATIVEEAGLTAETVHSVATELLWKPLFYRSEVGKLYRDEARQEGAEQGTAPAL